MTQTNSTKQKRKYNSRLRALLTKKQGGKDLTLLEEIIKEASKGISATRVIKEENKDGEIIEVEVPRDLDERKFCVKTIMDFMPFIMKKETPGLQIINNTQNNKITAEIPIQKLVDFIQERELKIEGLEARERTRQLKTLESSKKVSTHKLPANSPLNQ